MSFRHSKAALKQRSSAKSISNEEMLVDDLIEEYTRRITADADMKPETLAFPQKTLKQILKTWDRLQKKSLGSVTEAECLDWVNHLKEEGTGGACSPERRKLLKRNYLPPGKIVPLIA